MNEQENRNDAEPKYWLSTFLCIKLNGFTIYYDSTISFFYYNSSYDPYVYVTRNMKYNSIYDWSRCIQPSHLKYMTSGLNTCKTIFSIWGD